MRFGLGLNNRPSGPLGPSPISILGASLLAWWTTDRADLITLSGASVTSWKDVIHAYDAVQAVSASRPVYSATSFNGSPGITFDGTDDYLRLAAQPFPSGSDASDMWAIASQDATIADASHRAVMSYGGFSSVTQRVLRRSRLSNVNRATSSIGNGTSNFPSDLNSLDLSSRHVMRTKVTPTQTTTLADDLSAAGSGGVPATGVDVMTIGAASTGVANTFWLGKIRDVLITGPLTTEQVTALKAWAMPRRKL